MTERPTHHEISSADLVQIIERHIGYLNVVSPEDRPNIQEIIKSLDSLLERANSASQFKLRAHILVDEEGAVSLELEKKKPMISGFIKEGNGSRVP